MCKGFYHYDYKDEQSRISESISETDLLKELIAQNLYSVKGWANRN